MDGQAWDVKGSLEGQGLQKYWGLGQIGFSEIRGTILGVPVIRFVAFWGLYCILVPLFREPTKY